MSLRLLLDEDIQAKTLVNLLRQAHHDVVTVNEAKLSGSDDTVVLDYARREKRLLLTQNCKDFKVLHNSLPKHLGILAVYRENNPSQNITFKAIVKAIANLEESGIQECQSIYCTQPVALLIPPNR